MPPPPSKKARSAATSVVVEPPLGPITSGDSLFDSDSDLELASAHGSGGESDNAGSSNSNSHEEVVLSAPRVLLLRSQRENVAGKRGKLSPQTRQVRDRNPWTL